jgi:hydrogenase maturation protease
MEPASASRPAAGGVLIAGVGNIFLGDDGFGVEVAQRLVRQQLPAGVQVADFGIRALHLAYELLDGGYGTTILVDATSRGEAPGTVYLIEPDLSDLNAGATDSEGLTNAHGVTPDSVFRLLASLGGKPGRVLIVGCEPDSIEERMGLSETVDKAVDEAVALILDLLRRDGAALTG